MKPAFRGLWIAPILIILTGVLSTARQSTSLPVGTQVQVRLLDQLDTENARGGQTFSATIAAPIAVGGRTALSTGTKVSGRVVEAVSSGRLKRPASITLELIQAGGGSLATEPLRIDGKSHLLRNVAIIGGESAAGAIIGAATAGKKGAVIGGAIGAGAGTATAFMTGKKEIVLPVETALTFVVAGAGSTLAENSVSYTETAAPRQSVEMSRGARRDTSEREPFFSERDRHVIRRYFARNSEDLPPGLAKRGGKLPPGLERQLERNGTLPPGLQKRVERFPEDLEERLPRLPGGFARVILGRRALILDNDNRILDSMLIRQSRHSQDNDEDDDE